MRLQSTARIAPVILFLSVLLSLFMLPAQTAAQSTPAGQEIKISVTGDVTTPLTLTASDLAAMPRDHVEMPDANGAKVVYDGVPLQEILKKAGLTFGHMRGKALSTYVVVEGSDGYGVVFSVGELDSDFGSEHILLADERDGKPLPEKEGPARLVIPADKAGARSVRMLVKIEVVQLRK